LFDIGAYIATESGDEYRIKLDFINETHISFLENAIDEMVDVVPELKSFVLPGGSELNAFLHIARAVCRRVERNLWALKSVETDLSSNTLIYVNRLSDLLFALSRYFIIIADKKEYLWKVGGAENN
jgi:cob(I)alamin adenosyltransferase